MGPGLRVQPKASQKKVQSKSSVAWKWWTHPETLALIDIWGDTMAEHCKTYKGKRILPSSAYEKIAERLGETGVKRSVEQIREKIKTLKKSFWNALAKNGGNVPSLPAGRVNGKRQSVIEKMMRVLQINGNIVKGKYTWKTEQSMEAAGKVKNPKKTKRGRKSSGRQEEPLEAEEEDEDEEDDEEIPDELMSEMNGNEEMSMGITVEPDHIHGPSEEWGDVNGVNHMSNADSAGGGSSSGGCGSTNTAGAGGELTYDYPLCQVIENMMNKFLVAQRESEERFLMMEDERMKADNKRWETIQKRDAEVINKLLQTHDRWRKEDREQELRMWAAFASKVGKSGSNSRLEPPSSSPPDLAVPFAVASPSSSSQVQWQFQGTFRPSPASESVPSSSPTTT